MMTQGTVFTLSSLYSPDFRSPFIYSVYHMVIYTFHTYQCSIPFSVDDISKSMQQIDVADIDPPSLIRENSGFGFLLPRAEWCSWSWFWMLRSCSHGYLWDVHINWCAKTCAYRFHCLSLFMCIVHTSTQAIRLGVMSGSIHFFPLKVISTRGEFVKKPYHCWCDNVQLYGHWCPVTSAKPAEALFYFFFNFSYSSGVFRSCSGVF